MQHWQPDAPADDPIQGFAVAPVIDDWLTEGEWLLASDGLMPGLYPAQNAYTTYSENWQFSELGADADLPAPDADVSTVENRITVQFEGTAFAIATRRDDYLAYLYVTVDGKPANALPRNRQGEAFIILTSPERKPPLGSDRRGEGLGGWRAYGGDHSPARDHGDDRWPIAGFAVASPPDTEEYDRALIVCAVIGGLAVLGAVITATRLPWRSAQGSRAAHRAPVC